MNTIVQTPANNLEKSLDFYKTLNFKVLSEEAPIMVTDGKVILEINTEKTARAGVKLFRDSWTGIVVELEKLTTVVKIEKGYLLSDSSGVWIYLIESTGPSNSEANDQSFSVLGGYAGVSMETISIENSMKIWEVLGFSKTMGAPEQGWVAMANEEGFGVSFMKPLNCPHLFFNPSLTYFNGKKNMKVIQKVRELNIPITEEVTVFNKEGIVDNIIIRDPGGFGFFLFSD